MADLMVNEVLLLPLLLSAVWKDVRESRIPNALTFAFMLLGVLLALMPAQPAGAVWMALKGLLLGGGLLLPFYLLGLMGGGDVKLMAALGALLGWPGIASVALLSLLSAGVLSLVLALYFRQASELVRNVYQSLVGMLHGQVLGTASSDRLWVKKTGRRSPHAVAVAVGCLLYVSGIHWDW